MGVGKQDGSGDKSACDTILTTQNHINVEGGNQLHTVIH